MAWFLPESRRQLIRLYTNAFHSREWSSHRRKYLLYLILRPAIGWIKDGLMEMDLEPEEAESEIFLLVCKLFSGYDADKSCFLYHIESNLPWRVTDLMKRLRKQQVEEPAGLLVNDEAYEMDGEVYLTVPNLLFETRWLTKNLSQYEKNLILRMLIEDQPSCRALANSCQVSKSTMNKDLQILAGKLKGRLS